MNALHYFVTFNVFPVQMLMLMILALG